MPNLQHYPYVHIVNYTLYAAAGSVSYPGWGCDNDTYSMGPRGVWTASSRGLCLVSDISATLVVDGKPVAATPYQSTGTAYSQFHIVMIATTGPLRFAVLRKDDAEPPLQQDPPADYVVPTTQQK